MDKQKVVEIVESSDVLCNRCQSTHEIQFVVFTPEQLQQFAAAILLEAAKVCDKVDDEVLETLDENQRPAAVCMRRLEEIAKELTQ